MHTPRPPLPPYPPSGVPGESDEDLAGLLRGRPHGEATRPVALLTARHWQPTYDYAVICLATQTDVAAMVAATAFHQVLGRLGEGESGLALRPRFLVTVRDTVRDWAGDGRISGALPDLRKPAGGRGMRTAKTLTAENRRLTERAFLGLPGLARCLLWHTEVEAEPLSVPAGLAGMDTDTASAALEQARDQFREGLVRAHRELAPSRECGFYNRLLDVQIRRGGTLLPDVRLHLGECAYCRHAAEQLRDFEEALGFLLAEAVLGWGARRYLESRPSRVGQALRPRTVSPFGARRQSTAGRPARSGRPGRRARPVTAPGAEPGSGGRHRLLAQIAAPGRRAARPAELRPSQALLAGAGVSAALLATVLAVSLWSNDDGAADPAATTGASSSRTLAPDPGSPVPPVRSGPSTPAGVQGTAEHTRLRNLAADLCLDIRGTTLAAGVGTRLAVCSSAWTQQWSYEQDGLLRSVADPGLCLDSHADNGVVLLVRCVAEDAKRGKDMRYDLTVQGELLPRWHDGLAVAPESTDPDGDVLVKVRDGSDAQRWRTDGSSPRPDSLSVVGTNPLPGATGRGPSADGGSEAPGEPTEAPATGASADPRTAGPRTAGPGRTGPRVSGGEPKTVTVDDGHRSAPAPRPLAPGPATPGPAGPGVLPIRLPDTRELTDPLVDVDPTGTVSAAGVTGAPGESGGAAASAASVVGAGS
ncbi:ricin-type beta-trefoil lectin domain protein [Streptomyces sp. NPDC001910]|uniref:ricin-type beta-trefoil lectin domain protein n=1 Tax=Streptomyces sp. NPDC001910 TaxID=3154403 RepID=UPI003329426D